MATWIGAIVDGVPVERFLTYARGLGIDVYNAEKAPFLVHIAPSISVLHPPQFAQAMSQELECTVVAFFVQTTASVEELEHWENGVLKRRLAFSADEGGWLAQEGNAQPWEAAYFFSEGEGTGDDEQWPLNLLDDISDEEIERYNTARKNQDAAPIMDLFFAGSTDGVERVCAFYGLDAQRPNGLLLPKRKFPYLILLLFFLFFAVSLGLGVLLGE